TLRPAFTEHDRAKLMQQVLHDEPPTLRRVDRSVPRDLETIIHKAMAREPERRYPTARALAEDLQRCIEDRPIRARRSSTRERLWRWCRRNPVIAGLIAAVLVVTAVGFGATLWQMRLALVNEAEAVKQQGIAEEQTELRRRLLYASDINVARQAWEEGN